MGGAASAAGMSLAGGFGKATGRFTLMVWKGTMVVGCGRERCDGRRGSAGWFVGCEYYLLGNGRGAFGEDV